MTRQEEDQAVKNVVNQIKQAASAIDVIDFKKVQPVVFESIGSKKEETSDMEIKLADNNSFSFQELNTFPESLRELDLGIQKYYDDS